jgi:hypothetical protein
MDNSLTLIPLFGIVFAVGLPLCIPIIFIVLHFRNRVRLLDVYHAERMAAIERGMDLPPLPMELLEGRKQRRRRSALLPGLIWTFVGLAVLIALRPLAPEAALLGLIPTGIGLAYLVYYFVEGRKVEAQLLEAELSERAAKRQIEARPL